MSGFVLHRRNAIVLSFLLLLLVLGCGKETTSKPEVDQAAPSLTSATGVDLQHVRALFNEAVQENSAETLSHYLIQETGGSGTLDVLSAVLLADGKTVSLETSSQSSITYSISVTGVMDRAGNAMGTQTVQFTGSSQPDTTDPVIAGTQPADGARGVDTTATVLVEFSEKMNRTSAELNFHLERATSGPSISGSFTWDANDTKMTFTPSAHLPNEARYLASMETGAMDAAGNNLASRHEWSFVTGNAGALSGNISYTGMPPFEAISIGVFRDPCLTENIANGTIAGPGHYSIDPVPQGTCYVGAFMDVNHSQQPEMGEPAGIHDANGDGRPDPITISAGQTRSGIDFELAYLFQLSTISGTVSKSPDVTQSDTTYVAFFTGDPSQGGGDPVDIKILPNGTGNYMSLPLEFSCYYAMCYMDVNHNQQLDFVNNMPAEPVGLYGQIVQGQAVFTPIFLIANTSGINMTLINFPGQTSPRLNPSGLDLHAISIP